DAQQPADGMGQLARLGQGPVQGGQRGREVALELLARRRQADPAAGPVEDLDAEPGLKDPHGLSHPGLGDAQALSRSAEVQLDVVTGDLADEGSLVTAMEEIEKVFLLSSPHPDAIGWHRNAIDAARRTQVQLLVRSSIFGADRESPAEFISAHTTCDRYLAES